MRAAPDSFLASAWLAQDWALLVAEDWILVIVPDWAVALDKHELMNDFLASPDSFLAEASALQFVIFVCCVLAANADDKESVATTVKTRAYDRARIGFLRALHRAGRIVTTLP